MTLRLSPVPPTAVADTPPARRRVTDLLLERRERVAGQIGAAESHGIDAGDLFVCLEEDAIRIANRRLYRRRLGEWAESDMTRTHAPIRSDLGQVGRV